MPNEFVARNGVIAQNNSQITGSLRVSGGITGSLFGTASFATSASTAQTASYVLNAVSASFAFTASSVNTLNQNVLITGSLTIGSGSIGSSENTLTLGAASGGGAGEGGQLGLNAKGDAYITASFIDNYQDRFRILKGTNAGSTGEVASFNLKTLQVSFPAYTSTASFPGTAVATLGVDSGGNILTINPGSVASASFATSASYALTASFLNGTVVSASYAATASFANSFPDQGFNFTQAVGSTTWTINHGLDTRTPLVDIYDSSYNQLIPATIVSTDVNTVQITFSTAQTGYAIVSKGSGISSQIAVSASFATTASYASSVGVNFVQSSPSTTWTINHNLNNRYPLVQTYGSDNLVLIPQSISGSSVNTTIITFSTAISGYARVI